MQPPSNAPTIEDEEPAAHQVDLHPVTGSGRLRPMRSGRIALVILVGTAVALLLALRAVSIVTLPHILDPTDDSTFQEARAGLPVPVSLSWNGTLIDLMLFARSISGLWLFAAAAVFALLAGLAYRAVVVPRPNGDGLQVESESSVAPQRASLGRWVLVLLLWAGPVRWAMPRSMEPALRVAHSLGTFSISEWWQIVWPYILCAVAAGAAGTIALVAIAANGISMRARAALASAGILLVGGSVLLQRSRAPETLAASVDLTPAVTATMRPYQPGRPASGVPEGAAPAALLARLAGIRTVAPGAQPGRDLLFFGIRPDGPVIVEQYPYTEDGLSPEQISAAPTRKFLAKRRYRTALSWTAIKHLYNVGTVHFDFTAALDACLLDLERCPHLAQCSDTVRAMLFTGAATDANRKLLSRWADEKRFTYPDRESQKLIGDLYVRFGMPQTALVWYRKAEMPKSFLRKVSAEKPLFSAGEVTGSLSLNGRPLVGVPVGVVPGRLNGLPHDLEPAVFHCWRDLVSPTYSHPLFPPFHPRPFALRWITASSVTDSKGRFRIGHLTEGQYFLICALPPGVKLNLPNDPSLHIQHPPGAFTVNYPSPTVNLSGIKLTTSKLVASATTPKESPFD